MLNWGGPGWINDVFEVEIEVDTAARTLDEDGEEKPLLGAGETIAGTLKVTAPPGKAVRHNGIVVRVETTLTVFESLRTVDLKLHEFDIRPPGVVEGTVSIPFTNAGVRGADLYDTYEGTLFGVRHHTACLVRRPWWTFDVLSFAPLVVRHISPLPEALAAAKHQQQSPPLLPFSCEERTLLPSYPLAACVAHVCSLGGRVEVVRSPLSGDDDEDADAARRFTLLPGDVIVPVSHAGANRSQVLRRVLLDLIREQEEAAAGGAERKDEGDSESQDGSAVGVRVREPHAAIAGVDRYSDEVPIASVPTDVLNERSPGYERALGEPRVPRLGEDTFPFGTWFAAGDPELDEATEYFTREVYGPACGAGSDRRVYVTFDSSAHVVLRRLVVAAGKWNARLDNVVVVVIALHDIVEYPILEAGAGDDEMPPPTGSATAVKMLYDFLRPMFQLRNTAETQGSGDAESTTGDSEGAAGGAGQGAAVSTTSDPFAMGRTAGPPASALSPSQRLHVAVSGDAVHSPEASPHHAIPVTPSLHHHDGPGDAGRFSDSEGSAEQHSTDEYDQTEPQLPLKNSMLRVECGGVCEFDFGSDTFALNDTLRGDIVFSELERPILLINLSLHRVETVDDEEAEVTIFQEDLLDVRKGGAAHMPIPCEGGSMSVELPLSALPLTPTYTGITGGSVVNASVRYFVRLMLQRAFDTDDPSLKHWDASEIVLVRTEDTGSASGRPPPPGRVMRDDGN